MEELKDSEKRRIVKLIDIITAPRAGRGNTLRRQAVKDILLLHNDHFGSSYNLNNTTCPKCMKGIISNYKKLIEKWDLTGNK